MGLSKYNFLQLNGAVHVYSFRGQSSVLLRPEDFRRTANLAGVFQGIKMSSTYCITCC
jgi:hypothetical protein